MKAVILAAGKGERIKGVVPEIPKPMIEFRGKPVLQHNIELCKRHGILDLFINTHYKPEVIREYFGAGERFGVRIAYSFEPELLGTAGAVANFGPQLGDSPFFVIYGDNCSAFDLTRLVAMSREHHDAPAIAFHWREETSASGVAEFDDDARILRFVEKPQPGESESRWVNAGIYYLPASILREIPRGNSDFALDILPALLKKNVPIYGVCEKVDVFAFDTPEMFYASQKLR